MREVAFQPSSKLLSILSRRYADDLLEPVGQIALAAEPHLGCHLRQGHSLPDESLRVVDSQAFLVGVGRHPDLLAKSAQEVVRAQRDARSQLAQADGLRITFVDGAARPLDGLPLPARRSFAE